MYLYRSVLSIKLYEKGPQAALFFNTNKISFKTDIYNQI